VNVTVVTDTTAALPPEVARRWGIRLVPLTLMMGDRAYRDGEIPAAELLARTGQRITTSGPPPGDFLKAIGSDAHDSGPGPARGAVIVTVAKALSSTFSAAQVAAGLSDIPVEVVDSTNAAGGQALVAIAAAQVAAAGGDLAQVAAAARTAAGEVRLVGCVESLDRLARSGRVPGLAAAAVRRVGLSFMFELRGGRIRPLRPAGSRSAAIERMARLCAAEGGGDGSVADIVVLEAEPGEFTGALRDRLRRQVPIGLDLNGTFGSAILVHAGPGVAGLAWRRRDPSGVFAR
jgi:DegV family protein with EDD domain